MTFAAGETLSADALNTRTSGARIATTELTSASSTFTSETELIDVDAAVVSGRRYRIRFVGLVSSSVADDLAIFRLYAGDSGDTKLTDSGLVHIASTSGFGYQVQVEVEWTASSTAVQTFTVSGQRSSGSGNLTFQASSSRPAYLAVEFVTTP